MFTLSATCVAIALADKTGTLDLVVRQSRFGGTYVAICDDHGVIEVVDNMDEALRRVEEVSR